MGLEAGEFPIELSRSMAKGATGGHDGGGCGASAFGGPAASASGLRTRTSSHSHPAVHSAPSGCTISGPTETTVPACQLSPRSRHSTRSLSVKPTPTKLRTLSRAESMKRAIGWSPSRSSASCDSGITLCMPLIISRTCSSVLPTIGSIVTLSFLLVTATSGDARNLDISCAVLVDISSRSRLSFCVALWMHTTVTRDSPALAGRTPCGVTFCIAHQPSIVVQKRVRYILSSRISTLAVR